ncbi:[protein-PII] uridylyltransferase [Halocynthiibacter namhaensis]|uniref:[protein-PII] uridylyltransferase n=1 Tax=Halocynthiibacter namhaensis TaxID=1290553 RepID=UPI0006903E4D|nr:[protein-PII] uridylyltransferase [Halocynthiibacter namhaensis]
MTGAGGINLPAPAAKSLICAPDLIIDTEAAQSILRDALADATDSREMRARVTHILRSLLEAGSAVIAEEFAKTPRNAHATVRARSWLMDVILALAYDVVTKRLHPNPLPTEGERLALIAVGGYGRGEMAPQSDVDLLFLTPWKITAWGESVVESLLYVLWDMKLKVGNATRTIRDCVNQGREDFTIRTALLENRYITGDARLAQEMRDTLDNELFKDTASEFIEAKLSERAARHLKQGGQRYMVEPNVKEAKGGLRDLQSLFWIAKYVHGAHDVSDLGALNLFTSDEFEAFLDAENFLWAVRCHLHLLTKRPTDKLTFDLQVEVADRMGYVDKTGRRAVEIFMQDYFRHATRVGELTRIFLTELEASHVKQAPDLLKLFRHRKRLMKGLKIVQNRISISDETTFLQDKLNILRLFEEALRTGYLIHPDTMRLLSANLDLIDDDMRKNPEAVRIFTGLLLKHGNPERALRRMNELGVLAAFVPEFEPIVAMMQFNMYHSYTVDEHTIQCISNLAQIERKELVEELPVASSILEQGINRKTIYFALLLHDIGKGRPDDHSVLGAKITRKVAPRLGLNKKEAETAEWLVRHHLLMSDVAQKRDISDPRTVRDFAKRVRSRRRLDLLTVLTVCDIRGVGPDTWNNWKAMLIRRLHEETANALENGIEALTTKARSTEARKALRTALPDWSKKALTAETKRHYDPYWQGLRVGQHVAFAKLLHDIPDDEIRTDIVADEDRDATRIAFVMADHHGIFSRMAGALAIVGANVVDARTYTSKDGYATAVFWVQDGDGHPFAKSRYKRLNQMIHKIFQGKIIARDALKDKDKIHKRERSFRVPTNISFDNEGSELYTIIEVDTRDRKGLLYDLTRALAELNVNIASAVIATYGEQVVDTFYVKDTFGLKYHAETKQQSLEKKLREAITQGAERART